MLRMTWYGTAALLFEDERERFVIDPFLKMLPPGEENEEAREHRIQAFRSCRSVLLTHGHLDHMGSVPMLYAQKDVTIYTTENPAKNLRSLGFHEEQIHTIAPNDHIQIDECQIVCLKGKHIKYDKPLISQIAHRTFPEYGSQLKQLLRLNRQYPEYHETIIYEILYRGKRILVMGSADLNSETEYPIGVDVLILPHQGRSDITEHNFQLLQVLQPKKVLIDHYDNAFPPLTSEVDCTLLMDRVHKAMPEMSIEKLQEGKTITL